MAMPDTEIGGYKSDLIELHSWKRELIIRISNRLMSVFVDNLGVEDPWEWSTSRIKVLNAIAESARGSYIKLPGRNYQLFFSWPQVTKMNVRGLTTWHEEEPGFKFVDRSTGRLLPFVGEIAREMSGIHRMQVNTDAGIFLFPKGDYSQSLGIRKAVVLG